MQLVELLPREHILVPLRAATVPEALDAMFRQLTEAGAIAAPDLLPRIETDRHPKEIVAIGEAAVLPHYRTEAVDRLVLALGIAPKPVRTAEPTGAQPRIFVLVLAPPGAATVYLQTTATIARLLRQPAAVQQLLASGSPEEVLSLPQLREKIQPRLTVRDIMAHHFDSVPADASVREAVDLMVRRRTRAIPVVGEKGEVVGLITERDVMRALLPQVPRAADDAATGEQAEARLPRAREIMTRSVLCISEEAGLDEVANLLINKDIEQLPVVHDGKLTGVLTRADMIRKLFGR